MVQVIDNNKYSIDDFTTSFTTPSGGAPGSTISEYVTGWSDPEAIDFKEVGESIEIIYKEKSNMRFFVDFNELIKNNEKVFKIIFSCKDGKWHKSERIYGNIIPSSDETYEFND